ncbi:hypothetical protein DYI23_06295 [Roseibium polysiphoniae]|uniref:Uncharacterized protein n=1 Tax=Roseibium polysiphoniae TaxID=2571221 RepID=A0A944GRL3_9HYPH|nr:hypothetical protein [Roseibium polysiphoniae]
MNFKFKKSKVSGNQLSKAAFQLYPLLGRLECLDGRVDAYIASRISSKLRRKIDQAHDGRQQLLRCRSQLRGDE